jgi:hypothetical protein
MFRYRFENVVLTVCGVVRIDDDPIEPDRQMIGDPFGQITAFVLRDGAKRDAVPDLSAICMIATNTSAVLNWTGK